MGFRFDYVMCEQVLYISLISNFRSCDQFVQSTSLHMHMHTHTQRFHVSSVLKERVVKAMVWDNRGSRLFYGDDQGRVAVAYIPKVEF